jgi:hypothetical protein
LILFRRLLLPFVAVVLVGGLGLDVAAKKYAEGQLASKAESRAGGQASASARISSFPFVGRALVSGEVSEVDLRMSRVVAEGVTMASLDIDLHGMRIDRNKLLSSRKVEVTAISVGTVTAAFDAAGLSQLAHVPVDIVDGAVQVHVAGRVVSATPSIDAAGTLSLQLGALPAVRARLPRSGLAPCAASSSRVKGGRLEVSCTIHDVPPALLRAAQ